MAYSKAKNGKNNTLNTTMFIAQCEHKIRVVKMNILWKVILHSTRVSWEVPFKKKNDSKHLGTKVQFSRSDYFWNFSSLYTAKNMNIEYVCRWTLVIILGQSVDPRNRLSLSC